MTPLTGYLLIGVLMALAVGVCGVRRHRGRAPLELSALVTSVLLVAMGWPLFVLLCFVAYVTEPRRGVGP